jgi:hypothetical protein
MLRHPKKFFERIAAAKAQGRILPLGVEGSIPFGLTKIHNKHAALGDINLGAVSL